MRADRLVATLLLLQARGRVTAAELAKELEVSVKTARRDLESLSTAGLPVYAQPGRGGGWQLLGGGRTDLSGLNAAETRALFLVAGPHTRLAPEAKAALRKLVRALPEPFREHATAAAEAVVLDAAGWGAASPPASPHLEVLQRAVVERVQVRLRYAGRSGAVTARTVDPLGVAAKGGTWYLLAETASGRRTFRVDRIRAVTPTERAAIRPPGFDLAQAWRGAVADVDARRTRIQAVVLAGQAAAEGLLYQFGGDARVGDQRPDGRLDVHIGGASTRQLAERLAGWATPSRWPDLSNSVGGWRRSGRSSWRRMQERNENRPRTRPVIYASCRRAQGWGRRQSHADAPSRQNPTSPVVSLIALPNRMPPALASRLNA